MTGVHFLMRLQIFHGVMFTYFFLKLKEKVCLYFIQSTGTGGDKNEPEIQN